MKRIINGKTYNTETAELIVSGDNGLELSDCWFRSEELYRTKKGNYFIFDVSSNIIVIDNNHKLMLDPYHAEITTIYEWLQAWNVAELPARETEFFSIIDA